MSTATASKMASAVIQLMQEGKNFNDAFAQVAHLFNIWHYKSEDKPTYNFFFRQVERRVKKIHHDQKLTYPPAQQNPKPQIDFKKMAAHDID